MTNTNLIQVEQVRERIAKMRSLGMEISPAMEKIILKETEIAFNEGKRIALDAVIEGIGEQWWTGEPRTPFQQGWKEGEQSVLSIINTIKG